MRNGEDFKGRADVVVVGGGVAGLSAARELAGRGLSVAIVERAGPGAEASGAAAGMLAPQAEADERDALFELLAASRDAYPEFAAALSDETGVDVELDRTGTLYLALTEEDERELEHRYAWQSRAGLAVERLTAADALALEPHVSPRLRLALRFPSDWQVENRRLVEALDAACAARGVRRLADAALRIPVEGGRAAGVETTGGLLPAGAVVVAGGAWASRLPLLASSAAAGGQATFFEHPRIEPVRGQMLCFDSRPQFSYAEFARHVVYTRRGYLVPRRDGRVLAGSTTEQVGFERAVTAAGAHEILTNALEMAPAIADLRLADSWSGLRPRAEDGRPVIGASAEIGRLFYAAGYYRNGILLAPLTGRIIADLVAGGRPRSYPPAALEQFSPGRFRSSLAGSHAS